MTVEGKMPQKYETFGLNCPIRARSFLFLFPCSCLDRSNPTPLIQEITETKSPEPLPQTNEDESLIRATVMTALGVEAGLFLIHHFVGMFHHFLEITGAANVIAITHGAAIFGLGDAFL